MAIITTIDPQVLQLTCLLLKKHSPLLLADLPAVPTHDLLQGYPHKTMTVNIEPEVISDIIAVITDIGNQWIESNGTQERHILIYHILQAWIKIGEQTEQTLDSHAQGLC